MLSKKWNVFLDILYNVIVAVVLLELYIILPTMKRSINELPNEMLIKIFSLCKVEDLVLNVQYVNRHWKELVHDAKVWKHLSFFPKRSACRGEVTEVLVRSPLLQSLVLLEHVDDFMINLICSCCPLLKSLEFYDIHTVTVLMLEKISKYLPLLQNLTLRSMDFESKKFAVVLGQFHNIKKLSLLHNFYTASELLKCIADGCKSLEYLRLDSIDVSDVMMQYFVRKKAPQLRSLLLDGFRLSSAALLHIRDCSNLEVFMFHDCTTLTEEVFLDIVTLPKLRCLQLPEACQISANTLRTGLQQLNLSDLTELNISKSLLDDDGVKCLSENCHQIKYLNLASCICLTDCAMMYISCCQKLQHLNVKNCGFTDKGMEYLPCLHHLRYLNISKNSVTDLGMQYVIKCTQLTGLQINYCCVTASAVEMILSALKLSIFSCVGCKIFNGQKYEWFQIGEDILQQLNGRRK